MEKIKMGLFDGMDLGGGTAVATEERVAGGSNFINKTGAYDVVIQKAYMAMYRDWETDRKSTRLNSSHITRSRMPSSA